MCSSSSYFEISKTRNLQNRHTFTTKQENIKWKFETSLYRNIIETKRTFYAIYNRQIWNNRSNCGTNQKKKSNQK